MPRIPIYTAPSGGSQVQFQGAPYHLPYPLDAAGFGQEVGKLSNQYLDIQDRLTKQEMESEAMDAQALTHAGLKKIKADVQREPDRVETDPTTGVTTIKPIDRKQMFYDRGQQLFKEINDKLTYDPVKRAFANHFSKQYYDATVDMGIEAEKTRAAQAFVKTQETGDLYARLAAEAGANGTLQGKKDQQRLTDEYKDYTLRAEANKNLTPEQHYAMDKKYTQTMLNHTMNLIGARDPIELFSRAAAGEFKELDSNVQESILHKYQVVLEKQQRDQERAANDNRKAKEQDFTTKILAAADTPEDWQQLKSGTFPGIPSTEYEKFVNLKKFSVSQDTHHEGVTQVMTDYSATRMPDVNAKVRAINKAMDQLDQMRPYIGEEAAQELQKAYRYLSSQMDEARSENRAIETLRLQGVTRAKTEGTEAARAESKPPSEFSLGGAGKTHAQNMINENRIKVLIEQYSRPPYKMSPDEAKKKAVEEVMAPQRQQRQRVEPDKFDKASGLLPSNR